LWTGKVPCLPFKNNGHCGLFADRQGPCRCCRRAPTTVMFPLEQLSHASMCKTEHDALCGLWLAPFGGPGWRHGHTCTLLPMLLGTTSAGETRGHKARAGMCVHTTQRTRAHGHAGEPQTQKPLATAATPTSNLKNERASASYLIANVHMVFQISFSNSSTSS